MQKSELKTQTLKNSLKQGDLNIIMKTDPLKKNIKKSNILSHLVTCRSSKHNSTVADSDSEFFGKKYKNSPILYHFFKQNSLKQADRARYNILFLHPAVERQTGSALQQLKDLKFHQIM
jgi:hypothetical protein